MDFDTFKKDMVRWMQDRTGEEYCIRDVVKNNDNHYTAITKVFGENGNMSVAPTIYLEPLYNQMQNEGMTFAAAATIVETNFSQAEEYIKYKNLPDFNDYGSCKDKIYAQLVNLPNNEAYLRRAPYKEMAGDLAISYRFLAGYDQEGLASTLISNDMLNAWGISKEELHETAMKNTPNLFPVKLQSMVDTILEKVPEEMRDVVEAEYRVDGPQMYVLSNVTGLNGATALLYPETQEMIQDIFDEEVYILPSSIHECVIIPQSLMTREEALELVNEANHQVVGPQDYLSSSIYEYEGVEISNLNLYAAYNDFDLEDFETQTPEDGMEPEL